MGSGEFCRKRFRRFCDSFRRVLKGRVEEISVELNSEEFCRDGLKRVLRVSREEHCRMSSGVYFTAQRQYTAVQQMRTPLK